MADWLGRLTRFHHYHYLAVAVGLFVATVTLGEPGTHDLALGPLRVDAFWIGIASSLLLFVLSATDRYDPADYGLGEE